MKLITDLATKIADPDLLNKLGQQATQDKKAELIQANRNALLEGKGSEDQNMPTYKPNSFVLKRFLPAGHDRFVLKETGALHKRINIHIRDTEMVFFTTVPYWEDVQEYTAKRGGFGEDDILGLSAKRAVEVLKPKITDLNRQRIK